MENKLETSIGTRDGISLEPAIVKVLFVKVEMQKNREQKDIGEKVTLSCKHPKKDSIDISSVKFEKQSKIQVTGLWYKLDEDGNIAKNSSLAILLNFYKAKNLKELIGKDLQTSKDDTGYLCIKAY